VHGSERRGGSEKEQLRENEKIGGRRGGSQERNETDLGRMNI
jgi:hypothetical protein